MFEEFSSGYYLGEMYVEPHDGECAVIQRADHERVNEQLYDDEEPIARLDRPLVMKLDGPHFPVVGDEGIPSGTLAVPEPMAPERGPARSEVFLARPERAGELLEYAGYDPVDAT